MPSDTGSQDRTSKAPAIYTTGPKDSEYCMRHFVQYSTEYPLNRALRPEYLSGLVDIYHEGLVLTGQVFRFPVVAWQGFDSSDPGGSSKSTSQKEVIEDVKNGMQVQSSLSDDFFHGECPLLPALQGFELEVCTGRRSSSASLHPRRPMQPF